MNSFTTLATTTATVRTYTVNGLSKPGETYQFIVRAVNSVGSSTNSAHYSVIAATVPNPPTSFTRNNLMTTKAQVAFSWSAPTSNGGSLVRDYSIEMDDNNDGSFILVASGITATTYLQTGLSAGTSYNFRVRARNAVGLSSHSVVFTILAATVPSQPNAPTTTLSGDLSNVVIAWTPPSDLGGLSISSYKLEIKTSTATFEKDLTNCDAETSSSILSSRSCSIPVATLRSSPFNLVDSASVTVRVTAYNAIG